MRNRRAIVGAIYGRGALSISQQIGCEVDFAQEFLDGHAAGFPDMYKFIYEVMNKAMIEGYMETANGRLYFHDPSKWKDQQYGKTKKVKYNGKSRNVPVNEWSHARRTYSNYIAQGPASDLASLALAALHRDLYDYDTGEKKIFDGTGEHYHSIPFNFVHDSLMIDTYLPEVFSIMDLTKRAIEVKSAKLNKYWMDLPIEADCEIGFSWGELLEVKSWDSSKNTMTIFGEESKFKSFYRRLRNMMHGAVKHKIVDKNEDSEVTVKIKLQFN